jgi:hypothetical protein
VVDSDDDKICCVCMDAPREAALVPCGHLALCLQCAMQLKAAAHAKGAQWCCPVCRLPVKSFIRIYL